MGDHHGDATAVAPPRRGAIPRLAGAWPWWTRGPVAAALACLPTEIGRALDVDIESNARTAGELATFFAIAALFGAANLVAADAGRARAPRSAALLSLAIGAVVTAVWKTSLARGDDQFWATYVYSGIFASILGVRMAREGPRRLARRIALALLGGALGAGSFWLALFIFLGEGRHWVPLIKDGGSPFAAAIELAFWLPFAGVEAGLFRGAVWTNRRRT